MINGITFAEVLTYHDDYIQNHSVDTQGTNPVYWVKLGFPDNTNLGGTYNPNVPFEYNDYYNQNQVNSLAITLHAKDDNSNYPINIWLSFKGNHSDKFQIGAYDVPTTGNFTLSADIKNNALLYDGGSGSVIVGTLLNGVDLETFVSYLNSDIDAFWVGYACHFTHIETEVNVSVGSSSKTPEPATMLLFGSGLAGLLGLRRKFKKQ